MFELDPQLQKDCVVLGKFSLSLLLMNRDANYPWFILVPQRVGVTEIYRLTDEDQQQLLKESSLLSAVLVKVFFADKLNVAALGNVVSQLHVHHIVRYQNDSVWPKPVWGTVEPANYSAGVMEGMIADLLEELRGQGFQRK